MREGRGNQRVNVTPFKGNNQRFNVTQLMNQRFNVTQLNDMTAGGTRGLMSNSLRG